MWSKLGTSIDISLDNLTPYSKGQKSQPISNVPMNAMTQQSPIRQPIMTSPAIGSNFPRLTTPPMSPTGMNMYNRK